VQILKCCIFNGNLERADAFGHGDIPKNHGVSEATNQVRNTSGNVVFFYISLQQFDNNGLN